MFLINCLGFYASHPAALCNLAGPICLFQQAAFAFILLSHPFVEQPLGTHIILGPNNNNEFSRGREVGSGPPHPSCAPLPLWQEKNWPPRGK